MLPIIDKMISETKAWQRYHNENGNRIEAAACAIRIKAFMDVRKAIEGLSKQKND